MNVLSCQNCWFNGLQYGALGLPVGYCIRHRKILNFADRTTCGMQIRKDLSLNRANEVAIAHSKVFIESKIVRWIDSTEISSDVSSSTKDLAVLQRDKVGEAVTSYGSLNSKIESLSQLGMIHTARSDVAMTSLARAYVSNCIAQGGRWTSGLHLYWWTKKRLADIPKIEAEDLRFVGSTQLARQIELTSWSVMMFRLSFVDDVIQYAKKDGDEIAKVGELLNRAATAVSIFNVRKLGAWIRKDIIPELETRLDRTQYEKMANELHKENEVSGI